MPETLSVRLLRPARAFIDIAGAGVEGPRSLTGVAQAINIGGGGLVTVRFENCRPHNESNEPLRYLSRLAGHLNGGVRSIWVPIWNDLFFPSPAGWRRGDDLNRYSGYYDGSDFSDGSQFSQSTLTGVMSAAAALNASELTAYLYGSGDLIGGEWFGVWHPTRGKRVYQIREIVDQEETGSSERLATFKIVPPLREAVAIADELEFFRPECEMRLAPGTSISLPIEPAGLPSVDISFVESSWAD